MTLSVRRWKVSSDRTRTLSIRSILGGGGGTDEDDDDIVAAAAPTAVLAFSVEKEFWRDDFLTVIAGLALFASFILASLRAPIISRFSIKLSVGTPKLSSSFCKTLGGFALSERADLRA